MSKSYEQVRVVKNVSFCVPSRGITGFLGPNGAGKSTIIKMIVGCLATDAGEVFIDGKKANPISNAQKNLIGYLPENNPLYVDLYVSEYLHFIAALHHIRPASARIAKCLDAVGITRAYRNKKIVHLSKGYRQRVGLAATLLHDPQMLILDEPFSGLDPNQIQEIRALLQQLAQQKTILFSTHILQEAELLCDHILVIHKGEIFLDTTREHLADSPEEVCVIELSGQQSTTEWEGIRPHVLSFSLLSTAPSVWAFRIRPNQKESFSQVLMQVCAQQQWTVCAMNWQKKGLADIFAQLP